MLCRLKFDGNEANLLELMIMVLPTLWLSVCGTALDAISDSMAPVSSYMIMRIGSYLLGLLYINPLPLDLFSFLFHPLPAHSPICTMAPTYSLMKAAKE